MLTALRTGVLAEHRVHRRHLNRTHHTQAHKSQHASSVSRLSGWGKPPTVVSIEMANCGSLDECSSSCVTGGPSSFSLSSSN